MQEYVQTANKAKGGGHIQQPYDTTSEDSDTNSELRTKMRWAKEEAEDPETPLWQVTIWEDFFDTAWLILEQRNNKAM
jgi:hypothetical protein